MLIYTLVRYKMSTLTRLVVATLGLLALFQLSEFTVCGATHWSAAFWSRVGYMAITMLPPVGLHLIRTVSGRGPRWLVQLAYVTGVFVATVFGFSSTAFQSHICAGNYAIFQLAHPIGGYFFAYYYGWLIIGIVQSLYLSLTVTLSVRKALVYQVFGYLSFLLPTGIVNALNPQTISGIPSVMCGFAVIYAIVLSFGIAPLMLAKRRSAPQK
ncbi:MAG: hypothetical protein ACQR33_01965 [Candidatus Saccharibacteria bacterium]